MDRSQIQQISQRLSEIEKFALQLEDRFADLINAVNPRARNSARNLIHYLALRHHDISQLQDQLSELGISSLQHSESHVMANISAIQSILHHYMKKSYTEPEQLIKIAEGVDLRKKHREALLGSEPSPERAYIMVTMDSSMAHDDGLVREMVVAGMDCARINCAKDNTKVWKKIADNVLKACKELDKSCKILMDLGGPKIRTGSIQEGPRLVQIKPERDDRGETIAPSLVKLVIEKDPTNEHLQIPVDPEWLRQIKEGDEIRFKDTRQHPREAKVVEVEEEAVFITLDKVAFIETGTNLHLWRNKEEIGSAQVGKLPAISQKIYLKKGDQLRLHRVAKPGEPARYNDDGELESIAHIACTLPEVFGSVKKEEPIRFDDGTIEGIITKASEEELLVEVTYAKNGERSLKEDKGINFPESDLQISGLTEKDKEDLDFVVQHADIVNLSFVRTPEDVEQFLEELKARDAKNIGIMLKIETEEGVKQLPWILLKVLQHYPAGVMIARGDLAVEIGWERMAVLQEEILWLCQAVHIPAVWATQVLEGVAKKGLPKRAEITDAAMAERADCIMLNKGDYIIKAIEMLSNIAQRMEKQKKKSSSIVQQLKL